MSALREAAQQALEEYDQIEFSKPGKWVMRITADRRIEVNEDVTVTEAAQTVLEALQTLLEQPEQEPCIGKDPRCPCQDGDACHYRDCGDTKALPVPQPQRKPLTEDMVHRAMIALNTASCGEIEPTYDEMKAALEAAHGIKETP